MGRGEEVKGKKREKEENKKRGGREEEWGDREKTAGRGGKS